MNVRNREIVARKRDSLTHTLEWFAYCLELITDSLEFIARELE
jgi:hypothetical protein